MIAKLRQVFVLPFPLRYNFTNTRFILIVALNHLSTRFVALALLNQEVSPLHLKDTHSGFSLVHLNGQHHSSHALEPLSSKRRMTWTQVLRPAQPTANLITKMAQGHGHLEVWARGPAEMLDKQMIQVPD